MKYLISIITLLTLMVVSTQSVSANPTNPQKAENNPNVVAYYATGDHTIPGEEGILHLGEDLVMAAGKSGNFHQWFLGISGPEGYHGEHSLWLVTSSPKCPDSFVEFVDPNPGWGDYLVDDATYCVHTNEYKHGEGLQ